MIVGTNICWGEFCIYSVGAAGPEEILEEVNSVVLISYGGSKNFTLIYLVVQTAIIYPRRKPWITFLHSNIKNPNKNNL